MSTLSPYKNEDILKTIEAWWKETYPENKAQGEPNKFDKNGWFTRYPVSILDLFQSYCEYTLPKERYEARLEIDQFAKCITQCRIMDLGGTWVRSEDWEPKDYEVRRAVADIGVQEKMLFLSHQN